MKSNIVLLILAALLIGGFIGYTVEKPKSGTANQEMSQTQGYGYGSGFGKQNGAQLDKGNCLADDCLKVSDLEYPAGELSVEAQNALNEAIQDEYKALSTYEAVIAKFGSVRPFSMVKGAEEQHIAALRSIYDKYGLDIPENNWGSQVSAPETLQEACQTGVEAEIANAALYEDELLPAVKDYEDITMVFTNLMNASQEKHLSAFERCN